MNESENQGFAHLFAVMLFFTVASSPVLAASPPAAEPLIEVGAPSGKAEHFRK